MSDTQTSWASLHPGLAILDDAEALASLGVQAYGAEEARDGGEALAERYADSMPMGTLWPNETWPRSQARARGKLQVAEGPAVNHAPKEPLTRQDGERWNGAWYLDPDEPDRLWFAFTEEAAPILWIPVRPTLADMKAAIESVRPSEEPLTREVRAWMGWMSQLTVPNVYSGELVEADLAQLTNYWLFNPYRGGATLSTYTVCTQSRATYELHYGAAYVWNVAYRPAPHAEAVRCVNEALGFDAYPLDMPVDLLGCVLGFQWMTRDVAERDLADEELRESWPFLICVWSGIGYREPDFESKLARFANDESDDVRRSVAQACHVYGFGALMKSMLEAERDPGIREYLEKGVHPQAPLVNERPFG